ncbi:hypothetical protein [Smaragdicoccus niigatensis]|uniref:hypothetical protein n=1 Tax=Smaragdicoccus niigatensis TaxID=359359 RepID=UPI00037EC323|nr:hypothetical protein [Smaragdicoccus niigatensis]
MTVNRKVAATAFAAAVSGLILTPAVAAADDIPRDPIQVPPGEHVYRPPESTIGNDDIHIDHAKLPDLSHLPDFDDFHIHFKHEKKKSSNEITTVFPSGREPIQMPQTAATDSIEVPQPNQGVPIALASAAILGTAAVRRTRKR